MRHPKVFHCRTTKTGPTTPVTVRFTKYGSNNTLAVQLTDASSPWCPFAVITVNLQDNPFGMDKYQDETKFAYVDTNNCPWAEQFLEENNIAKSTGIFAPSGFCAYPLYEFFPDAVWEEK